MFGLFRLRGGYRVRRSTRRRRNPAIGLRLLGRLRRLLSLLDAAAKAGLAVPETDVHAGGLETSMMLAAYPSLVRPFEGVEGYRVAEPGWFERLFAEGVRPLSPSGVLGDVRDATSAVGDALIAALADELAGFFARELGVERARTG